MSEKFNLSWKDFQSNVSESLSTLREEEDFFDVTLVSDDLQQFSQSCVFKLQPSLEKSIKIKQALSSHALYQRGQEHGVEIYFGFCLFW